MTSQYNIEFVSRRCFDCGTYWAIEKWRDHSNPQCPFCAADKIKSANDRADAAARSRQSLRGAITRLKK